MVLVAEETETQRLNAFSNNKINFKKLSVYNRPIDEYLNNNDNYYHWNELLFLSHKGPWFIFML